MPTREYRGHLVSVNDEGFMTDSGQWTREVAEAIAEEVGLTPLGERHWQVIDFCRQDAAREGQPPGLRRISKLSGVAMKELYELFPKGPGKLAARLAGLPKPKGCI
ncbi:MAG TPA: TusE/DsrC/DsvC family sulfur relay protein [Vicinamibacteria bacterium]|nr:TusE/DsrC/DsvC family sulfur relay protein [Vicinamibacteria bacterium]